MSEIEKPSCSDTGKQIECKTSHGKVLLTGNEIELRIKLPPEINTLERKGCAERLLRGTKNFFTASIKEPSLLIGKGTIESVKPILFIETEEPIRIAERMANHQIIVAESIKETCGDPQLYD